MQQRDLFFIRKIVMSHPVRSNLPSWYVLYCRPFKEWQTAAALETHLGLQIYIPQVKHRLRGKIQWVPFFPRYLFVAVNLQEVPLSRINAVPNVLRLLAFDEVPQPVPAPIVDSIRQQVDTLNAMGGLPEHGFYPGETVWIKQGPLRGMEAAFLGPMKPSERVQVLLEFLGELREVEVNVDALDHRCPGPGTKLERRTRGSGRRIKLA
jgi:transcriptional antiterminator RfaH